MPSSHAPSIALICPSLSETLVRQAIRLPAVRLPALERLVAYADARSAVASSTRALDAWQCELLKSLGLNSLDCYPSAPLTLAGSWAGGDDAGATGSTWLHAEPMVQSISVHGLAMVSAQWSTATLAEVEILVRHHLAAEQMQWRVANGRAYLQLHEPLDVHTVTARQATLGDLQDALPTGPGAVAVRRAMNELQMLMHEKLNYPAAPNAIWLWGAGTLPRLSAKELPPMWTNDDYTRGVYRMHAASAQCSPLATFDVMLEQSSAGRLLAMVRDCSLETLEAQWFAPALRALDNGWVQRVDLYLDGWQLQARRSLMRRLFGKSRPITEWIS